MRAAIYARVSTDKQADKYGISSQLEALRKRSLERGWTMVLDGDKDAFVDDGYSGAELDRPALNRLRQAVRLIFYAFANENLSLQSLADRLNRLHVPTPRGGDRWRASTL